ncbi:hypothetical protein AB0M95_34285 [Sphaerisporangium sp. NPDC051017]|uniref:hypothetical protein n=1 Tax=Sphaerisporangium sp. NPDC051017 TaxID=3154636 RepID=UPI00341F7A8D
MREAVEAADWVGRHVLSPASLSWCVRESLLPRLKTDSAIGDGEIRRQLHGHGGPFALVLRYGHARAVPVS